MPSSSAPLAVKPSERRRSPRWLDVVPLVIRGESVERKIFWEDSSTISISAHGALLILAAKVGVGQRLVLMNPRNWDERDVRVTRIGSFDGIRTQVGVEFEQTAAPEFWQRGSPPRKSFGP
jgi:PilZ domain